MKSNGRTIIEGANAGKGRPLAKGKFWELRTTATIPPGVMLVDMMMYEELSEKTRARNDTYHKRKSDEAQEGPIDRKPTLTIYSCNTPYVIVVLLSKVRINRPNKGLLRKVMNFYIISNDKCVGHTVTKSKSTAAPTLPSPAP